MPDVLILDELKTLILRKHEIREISPSDCRLISICIQKELHKNISETTLKRLFGFAVTKHPFSKFTINTLKEYVSSQEQAQNKNGIQSYIPENVAYIRQTAINLTQFTLRNIRNRSAVPFELTIGRKFAKYDFEYFYKSNHSYMAFIAQPGYGKSILMYHLLQEMFLDLDAPHQNDIVLFINADFIFNTAQENINFEEVLKSKLGLSPEVDFINYFHEYYQESGNRMVIFLDGFSELVVHKNFKPRIFDTIIAFISAIEELPHLKIVLSMRNTTWSRFFERMRHAHFLRKKWFPGHYYNNSYNANVPPLNEKELKTILEKMGPFDYKKMSSNLKSQLKFPFHIQWYYKLREEYPTFNSYTNIIFFEIIAKLIQEKIYRSTYATEKIIFCKRIVQLSNKGKSGHAILKTDLLREMSTFTNAYMQLLADGILMEEKQFCNGQLIEYIRFIQPHIFEYFLAVELLDLFGLDSKLFNFIQNDYLGNQNRFQLLQWCIRAIVHQKQFEQIPALLDLPLSNYEKNYLIYFIAENLNYQANVDPELLMAVKAQKLHDVLIQHLIHFDFIDSCYREAIISLLRIVDTDENAIIYHTILSIFDCLSLDIEVVKSRLTAMKKLNEEGKKWCINPYELLNLIAHKMKDEKVVESGTLELIEKFKNDESSLAQTRGKMPNTKDVVCFILILVANIFYGSPQETIKIIKAIFRLYPALIRSRNSFSIYLLTIIAQAYGRANQREEADRIEKTLNTLYNSHLKCRFTPYTQTILFSFRAEQSKTRSEYEKAIQFAEDCIGIYKRNDLAINRIFMYNLLVNTYRNLGDEEKMNDIIFKKLSLLDQKKINPSPFHNYNTPT